MKVEKGPLEHLRSVVNPRQIVQDGDEADENEEENDEGEEGEEVLLRAQVFAAAQRVVQLPQHQAAAPRTCAVSFEIRLSQVVSGGLVLTHVQKLLLVRY